MKIFGITLSNADLYLLGIAGALAVIVIGAILFRKNNFLIKRREQKREIINNILMPFNDAIVNIEHGEHNHIFIMNSFFIDQKEAVSSAKAIATERRKKKIQTAWNNYKSFYNKNAKGQVHSYFAVFPDKFEREQKNIIRSHLNTISKAIKNI